MDTNVGKVVVPGTNINVPVPWGHIAVKECGKLDGSPIFLMHGWLDNCGSFQPLLPYLKDKYRLICIDSPGHGLSSHYPPGMMYQTYDSIINIRRVANHFKLEKFGFIGHSMGANYGFLFAATHPEMVDFLIMLDIVKPISRPLEATVTRARKSVDDLLNCEKLSMLKSPKEHTLESATKRMIEGSNSLISKDNLTFEGCQFLLPRALKEVGEEKYAFTRDMRLYPSALYGFTNDVLKEFAKCIKVPHLVILATKCSGFEPEENIAAILKEYQENNAKFVLEKVDTTHHGHLTEPEKIFPPIQSFLEKFEEN